MVRAVSASLPLPLDAPGASPGRVTWSRAWFSLAGVLWVAIWLGIDTGPWVFAHTPRTDIEELHYVRTLFPLVALGVAILVLLARKGAGEGSLRTYCMPWLVYGMFALLACSTSPRPAHALYWALAYLSVILTMWVYVAGSSPEERLDRCRYLNHMSWFVAAGALAVLLFISRGALLVQTATGLSGYGVVNRVQPLAGVGIVRASGYARFAAVPAIFAFVLAWRYHGWLRFAWGAIAALGVGIVYVMQSRGATVALAAALGFAMLFMGPRTRMVGFLVLLVSVTFLATDLPTKAGGGQVVRHLMREGRVERTSVTTGRTRDWGRAWEEISKSPFLGWGPQADRYLLRQHVHNTYFYAWLAAGFFGFLAFVIGLGLSWIRLLRCIRDGVARDIGQHTTLIQVGCILAFFTVRGIPEVSGAMFGVDLLLMVPAMAWLGALDDVRKERALAWEADDHAS